MDVYWEFHGNKNNISVWNKVVEQSTDNSEGAASVAYEI